MLVTASGAQARKLLSEQKLQATAAATAEHHTAVHATRHTAREANAQLLAMAVAAPPAAADVPAAAQANVHAELTAEFMDNALEVDDKLDSLKHVSYRWKQPLNTPL
ncbi:hypothetical protein OEZ85_007047 [Tetradesmus obliquus]|uniref:Uncharacterized protein n=1 Tax=Tetradesmus obliquus TaxID=3088 RepID=A0ABY8TWV1_TETOB|nr:hypothetical protein OEZ85_007047 [Tetradesmus obliquus]